jgi:hypothetical protein
MKAIHPFMRQTLQVGVEDLCQILDAAGIDSGFCSPFPGLKIGAQCSGIGGRGRGAPIDPVIRALCRPRARIRLTTVSAGVSASVLDFFVTGDIARAVYLEGGVMSVSAGVATSELCNMVAEQLVVETPHATRTGSYDEGIVRLVTALWCGAGIGPSHSIPTTLAVKILERPSLLAHHGLDSRLACENLDRAINMGRLRKINGRIALESTFLYWMKPLWSGNFLEILYAYVCDEPGDQPGRVIRLMFAGHAASRTLITSTASKSIHPSGHGSAITNNLIRFSRLSRRHAAGFIRDLFKLDASVRR